MSSGNVIRTTKADSLEPVSVAPPRDSGEVMLLLILAAVTFVFWRAWVCDDAFITFRYVQNCLSGHGPVFNAGERVQGFTHPLWFLCLLGGSLFLDTYAVAILGGLACTAAIVWTLNRSLRTCEYGSFTLVLGTAFLLSSRSFVEFQTSGLETPLADLLIVVLFANWPIGKEVESTRFPMVRAVLVCSLLAVTRTDLAVICGPAFAYSAVQAWKARPRRLGALIVALMPAVAWYSFATVYYGTPLPNTAYAKVAFPLSISLRHGLRYLGDYALHEPMHALVMMAILAMACVWALRGRRACGCTAVRLCLPVGIVLHLVYVTCVGGDFMRGRFVVPALVASTVLACRILGEVMPKYANRTAFRRLLAQRPATVACVTLILAAVASLCDFAPRVPSQSQVDQNGGIADEYAWYAGYWNRPRFRLPDSAPNNLLNEWVAGGEMLRAYSQDCGPITIVWGLMGIMPYHAGPRVSVIDVLGLTDAFTARCPADPASRVGHIGHNIPSEYYQTRGTVNTLDDAIARMLKRDPSLITQARAMQQQVVWADPQAEQLWHTVRLVTTGPIFSWARLKAIPAYAFPHRRPFKPSTPDPSAVAR